MKNFLEKITNEEKIKFNHDKKQFVKELANRNPDIERCIRYCEKYNFNTFEYIKEKIKNKRIDKLFFVGMGSSLYASQYALTQLENCNILSLSIEAAEFKNKYIQLVDDHTLLIIISQSGNSKEIVEAVEELKNRKCAFELITITNNLDGYLYTNYENSILLNASKEFYISHNSYINTLIVIKYLFEFLFDECHFSLGVDVTYLLERLDDFDRELLKHKSAILNVFDKINYVDFIYDINSRFNAFNSTLLLREGLGLMTACYSKNEYLHGEHLAEIPGKLMCLIGVNDTEEKYNEIMNEVDSNKHIILTSHSETKIELYDNKIKINFVKEIKDLAEMIFFNQVVAWRMEG